MSATTTYTLARNVTTHDYDNVKRRIHLSLVVRVGPIPLWRSNPSHVHGGTLTITSDDGPGISGSSLYLVGGNLTELGLLHFAHMAHEMLGDIDADRISAAVVDMLKEANDRYDG